MSRRVKRASRARPIAPFVTTSTLNAWSNPATWGGTLPTAGSAVTISAGQTVVLDCTTNVIGQLTISGTLQVDAASDFWLRCTGVAITSTGKFICGTSSSRYARNGRISLTGTESNLLSNFGAEPKSRTGTTGWRLARLCTIASNSPAAGDYTVTITGGGATFSVTGPNAYSSTGNPVGSLFTGKLGFIISGTPTSGDTIVVEVRAQGSVNDGTRRGITLQDGAELRLYGLDEENQFVLGDHANAGASSLTLALTPTSWRTGDDIIIGTSDWYDTQTTLPAKITSVAGAVVGINTTVPEQRWGKLQYMVDNSRESRTAGLSLTPGTLTRPSNAARPDYISESDWANIPQIIDQRTPVARLTRNIIIEGDDDTAWRSAGFGAHIMKMGNTGALVLDGVRLRRVGQAGRLGRYPIHWHVCSYNLPDSPVGTRPSDGTFTGAVVTADNTVRNCAIEDSAQRMVVIHATHGVTVEKCIGHKITGHALFLEDGAEEGNILDDNWVCEVTAPTTANKLVASDITGTTSAVAPFNSGQVGATAGIWLSNPNNYVRRNRVWRSAGVGISNAFGQRRGLGTFLEFGPAQFGRDIASFSVPRPMPVDGWKDNVSHGNAWFGAHTSGSHGNTFGDIAGDQTATQTDAVFPTVDGLTTYKNTFGYHNTVMKARYIRHNHADNWCMDIFGVANAAAASGPNEASHVALTGESLNNANSRYISGRRAGIASYHQTLFINKSIFTNYSFTATEGAAISGSSERGGYGLNTYTVPGFGALRGSDLYTNPLFYFETFTGLMFNNADMGLIALPPFLDGQSSVRAMTVATAVRDKSWLWTDGSSGVRTVVPNRAFWTTGAADLQDVQPAGYNNKHTSSRYYGLPTPTLSSATVAAWEATLQGLWNPPTPAMIAGQESAMPVYQIEYVRLPSASLAATPIDTITVPGYDDSTDASPQLASFRAVAVQDGSITWIKLPDLPAPTGGWAGTVTGVDTTADVITLVIPYSGAETVTVAQIGKLGGTLANMTALASAAAVHASSVPAYWQDTANNVVWLRLMRLASWGAPSGEGTAIDKPWLFYWINL